MNISRSHQNRASFYSSLRNAYRHSFSKMVPSIYSYLHSGEIMNSIFRWSIIAVVLSVITGCSAFHLYDKENDDLARAAKTSFLDANLPDLAKQEYTLNQQTLEQQLDVVRRHAVAQRDAILAEVLDRQEDVACKAPASGSSDCGEKETKGAVTWGFLNKKISNRLEKLGLSPNNNGDAVIAAMRDMERLDELVSKYQVLTKVTQDQTANGPLANTQKQLAKNREELQKELDKLDRSGLFPLLLKDVADLKNGRQVIKSKVSDQQQQYEAAKASYEKAILSGQIESGTKELIEILERAELALETFKDWTFSTLETKAEKEKIFKAALLSLKERADSSAGAANKNTGKQLWELADKLRTGTDDTDKAILSSLQDTVKQKYKAASDKGNPVAFAWIVRNYVVSALEATDSRNLKHLNNKVLADLSLESHLSSLRTQMEAVNKMIGAFINNKGVVPETVDHDTDTAVRVALSIRSIANHYQSTKTFPSASGLLLESERLRIEYESAKQKIERADAHISLMSAKLEAMMGEIESLGNAKLLFAQALNIINIKTDEEFPYKAHYTSLIEDYTAGDQDLKLLIAKTLYYYGSSWSLGRVPEEEIDYRIIALAHNSALDSSVVALQQWNNLILVPLSSLAAYHASGLTVDQIARFLQAAGLGAIAGGQY